MQVYSLLGFVDYEGSDLLGVFGSLDDLQRFVGGLERRVRFDGVEVFYGYDQVGYVVSELGQRVDLWDDVVYL